MSNKQNAVKWNADEDFSKTIGAISGLVEQGCGDPHFIPLMTVVVVTKSSLRHALRDAHKNRYNQSLSNRGVGEVLSHFPTMRNAVLVVYGAHAQFDYRSTRTKNERDRTWTTLPYQSVNLRCGLVTCDGRTLAVGDLNHEMLEFLLDRAVVTTAA